MDKSKYTKAQLQALIEELESKNIDLSQDLAEMAKGYTNIEGLLHEKEQTIEDLAQTVEELQNELNKLMTKREEKPALRRVKDEDVGKLHTWAEEGYDCYPHPNHPRLIKGLSLEPGALVGLNRGNILFKVQGDDIYFPR